MDGEPEFRELIDPQHCYVCKRRYLELHPFYDQLCPACGELNSRKRGETADLRGRVAPHRRAREDRLPGRSQAAAGRVAADRDDALPAGRRRAVRARGNFEQWGDRLRIFGLDLRHTPSVETFCTHLASLTDRLDFIVNNACQTVRRPAEFYRHMLEGETAAAATLPEHVRRLVGEYEGLRRTEAGPGEAVDAVKPSPTNAF